MKRLKQVLKTDPGQVYPVVLHEGEDGLFWVECPTLEGCYSQGKTIEEALKNIREAIELSREDTARDRPMTGISLHFVTV